jgi:hypothetical protein
MPLEVDIPEEATHALAALRSAAPSTTTLPPPKRRA